jgi:hypothetical protein
MKNRLSDLNEYLFMQIEALSITELKGSELQQEVGRARAISGLAAQVIGIGKLALDVELAKSNGDIEYLPALLNSPVKEIGLDSTIPNKPKLIASNG